MAVWGKKALYGLKNAIRWHPGTSLASGHVVGIRARRWDQTNFAQTTKNDFFSKKQRKNFAVCEICRTFAPSKKNIT